jgi:hypothetical protein
MRCLTAFHDLSNAMTAYQNGVGPAPLVSEFESWRDLVATTVVRRRP